MVIGQFVTITDNTLDGPWHVGWRGFYSYVDKNWYIVNKDTGKSKKIGPVRSHGTNNCDKARAEATRRNNLLKVAAVA
jgi:hypothetical protein